MYKKATYAYFGFTALTLALIFLLPLQIQSAEFFFIINISLLLMTIYMLYNCFQAGKTQDIVGAQLEIASLIQDDLDSHDEKQKQKAINDIAFILVQTQLLFLQYERYKHTTAVTMLLSSSLLAVKFSCEYSILSFLVFLVFLVSGVHQCFKSMKSATETYHQPPI